MVCFLYILKSQRDGNYYVGITNSLKDRVRRHNAGHVLSTKARVPLVLVYCQKFTCYDLARRREKFLKSGNGHNIIPRLVNNYLHASVVESADTPA